MFDEVARVVSVVGGGDKSGLDGCRGPVGMSFAEEGINAGEVKAGYGGGGDDVEENAAGIDVKVSGGGDGGPAIKDVDAGAMTPGLRISDMRKLGQRPEKVVT